MIKTCKRCGKSVDKLWRTYLATGKTQLCCYLCCRDHSDHVAYLKAKEKNENAT